MRFSLLLSLAIHGLVPARAPAQVTCPGSDAVVLDCNGNGTDDYCDIGAGTSADSNTNGILDECDSTECLDLWAGFEPVPPFAAGTFIDGIDFDADGNAWQNTTHSWSIGNQGCPSNQGKALKGTSQTSGTGDTVRSEYFQVVDGRLDCGAAVYRLTFDARSEAALNPRIDWRMTIRDAETNADVILIHWASTQSSYPGVGLAQGGNGRGRILVANPSGSPALINTGFVLTANTCYRVEVVLDNVANTVALSINGTLRVTTTRLNVYAARMDYFRVQQAANGQSSGSLNRLGLDNFQLCQTGAALDWPDCDGNCVDDAVDLASGTARDCDSNGTPDECDIAGGTATDCNTNAMLDVCDIAGGTSADCNADDIPDECGTDCNGNGVPDVCDISAGSSLDCDGNAVPDECDPDCNANDVPDACDLLLATSQDCNSNGAPDECDLGAPSFQWRRALGISPSARSAHAMVYDSARGVTLLVGGWDDSADGETWEWDGNAWTRRITDGPGARFGLAMAYDSARGRVVLFGGRYSDTGYDGSTWEWGGSTWTLRSTTGPSPRAYHAMAYDSARGRTVLYGGYNNGAYYGDTWEWDGDAWTQRSAYGPGQWAGHALAYDSARGRVVWFGGSMTWEWDGNVWTARSYSGPIWRYGHAIAYDSARGRVVLFGGYDGEAVLFGDTWEWDGSFWSVRSISSPSPRYYHAMAYDSAHGQVVLFGGERSNTSRFGDTWELSSLSPDCNLNTVPDECDLAAGASPDCAGDGIPDECQPDCNSNGVADHCDLFSGTSQDCNTNGTPDDCEFASVDCNADGAVDGCDIFAGTSLDCQANGVPDECDLAAGTSQDCAGDGTPDECEPDCDENGIPDHCDLLFGTSQDCNSNGAPDGCDLGAASRYWREVSGGPGTRYEHAMAYDSARGVVVLFGGWDVSLDGETWEWDGSAWTLRATTGPSGRADHAMAYDSARGRVVLFGGYSTQGYVGDTWEWDGSTWTQRSTTGPYNRRFHGMAYDSARGRTVLYGGHNASFTYRDTWEWDGQTWTQRSASGAGGDSNSNAMVYDSVRDRLVLFSYDTTWEWNGSTWIMRSTTGPSARFGQAMAYDSVRSRVVLFGGQWSALVHDDTWEWDGNDWTLLSISNPSPRSVAAMAYDSARSRMVLFGGNYFGVGVFGDTWELSTFSADCNLNGVPDECDLAAGSSQDCAGDGVPDECQPDCNTNGVADRCDLLAGTIPDCDINGTPDECEFPSVDCNANGAVDGCDIFAGTSPDCQGNGVPDECDLAAGASQDCTGDGTPDECQTDCNSNGLEDSCDLAGGTSQDCNANSTPDSCELSAIAQLAKLLGNGYNNFGGAISLSGNRVLVAANYESSYRGSAYVFRQQGSNWVQEAKLTASDAAAFDYFGGGASLSGDRALVGAYGDDRTGVGSDSGSAYVFRREGTTWVQEAKLTAPDGAAYDYFGGDISLSGSRALVGADGDDGVAFNSGSAYVFRREGSTWTQEAKLTAADAAEYANFGNSVSISGDRALVGANLDDDAGTDSGSAYVFRREGNIWVQEAKLTASDVSSGAHFGESVCLSGDRALIGAYLDNDTATGAGSAYIFRREGGTWVQEAKLTASDAASYVYFGSAVSLSGDRALVGADGDDAPVAGFDSGSAYLFLREGNTWVQGAKLTAPDAASYVYFGSAVSLSGARAAVAEFGSVYVWSLDRDCNSNGVPDECDTAGGTSLDCNSNALPDECEPDCNANGIADDCDIGEGTSGDCNGNSIPDECDLEADTIHDCNANQIPDECETDCNGNGILDACDLDAGTSLDCNENVVPDECETDCNANFIPDSCDVLAAAQLARLTASDGTTDDLFGAAVSISGDRAVVGSPRDYNTAQYSGSAYVFRRAASTWVQEAKLTASNATVYDFFGESVSISGDRAIVGSSYGNGAVSNSGSAYVFRRQGGAWAEEFKLTASDAAPYDFFGKSVSISGDRALVGASLDDDACPGDLGCNSGSAYVFRQEGGTWVQEAKLAASDAAAYDEFGQAVSVSGDRAVVGAPSTDDAGEYDSGSAYIFRREGSTWVQEAKLTASDAADYGHFGESVSISGDRAVVGASYADGAEAYSGSAYVFRRDGSTWVQEAKLTASETTYEQFGRSVSISGDRAVVGAPDADDAGEYNSGSAYGFRRDGGTWILESKLTRSDGAAYDSFGGAVSISGDRAVVGAGGGDGAMLDSGSAYVWKLAADCNTNQVPDDCEIPQSGTVTSSWLGGPGLWHNAALYVQWCMPETPDNNVNATFDVFIEGLSSEVTLNISPSIEGLALANGGVIEVNAASGAAVRTLAVGSPISNDGTLRARDGRRFLLDASDINQTTNGAIEAIGGPGEASKVQINGRRVTGGHIRTSGDAAAVELLGGAVLEGVIVEQNAGGFAARQGTGNREQGTAVSTYRRVDVSTFPTVVVPNQQSGTLANVIQNFGRIDVVAVTTTTSLKPDASGASLTGDGVLVLRSPAGAPLAELGAVSRTLINSNGHSVEGTGMLVGILFNDGLIDANKSGDALVVDESGRKTLGASGVYRASAGGRLEIRKRINHPPDDAPAGALVAEGGAIQLRHPKGDAVVVRCASADATSNGVIELADGSGLELTGSLRLDSGGACKALGSASGTVLAAELTITGSDDGNGGQMLLSDSMRAEIGGPILMNSAGSCRAERGCTPPLMRITQQGLLRADSLASAGGLIEVGDSATASIGGEVMLDSGAVYRSAGSESAASLSAGSVVVEGGMGLGGELRLSDSMSLEVSGDMAMRAGATCRGIGNSEQGTGNRGCTPPLMHVTSSSQARVGGSLLLEDAVDLAVESSAGFELGGDFDNRSTTPLTFDWDSGSLMLDGATQTIEAAGQDRGADAAGLDNNFAFGTLTLASGAIVAIADVFDNQQDGFAACDEALYVNTLIVEAGATLVTNGCRVYYTTLVNHGSIPSLGTNVIGMAGTDSDNDGVPDAADICPGFNDFADCDADGTPDGCESDPDCNANGVPDVCESVAPCAHVVGATSWRTHGGGVGRDAIVINPAGRVDSGGVTTEPRIGGIVELRIAFDVPPGGPGSAPVTIEQRTCGDGGAYAAYAGATSASGAVEGHELVLQFSPSLPNARTYRLTVAPEVTAAPGEAIEVRVLAGDVNNSGRVNGMDRSAVVAVWSGTRYSAATDITLDGRTNSADRSVVVTLWTGAENCAP